MRELKPAAPSNSFALYLEKAGWLTRPQKILFITFGLLCFFFSFVFLYSNMMGSVSLETAAPDAQYGFFKKPLIFLAGIFLPYFVWRYRKATYQKKIFKELIDVITLLLILLQSGLAMREATAQLLQLLKSYHYVFAAQLERAVIELTLLPNRSQAWTNLNARCEMEEIYYLTDFLKHEGGADPVLTEALAKTRDYMEEKRISEIERKARQIAVYVTIPLGLFLLPSLIVILLAPTITKLILQHF